MSGTMNLTARAEQADSDRALMREVLLELRAQRAHSSDLFHHVMSQNRNGVLETGSLTIGTDGWVERDFRAAYAAIAVTNPSAAQLTVSSSPPAGFQPTGPASGIIPAGCFGVLNLSSNSVTIYGTAGTKVTYSAFIDPQPPIICALASASSASGQAQVAIFGKSVVAGDTAVGVDAIGRVIVVGTSANNVDAVVPSATSVVQTGSQQYAYNGASWDRVRSGGDNADAVATTTLGVPRSAAEMYLFNGTTWDRARSNGGSGGRAVVAPGTGVFNSLAAVTATGAGVVNDLQTGSQSYSMGTVVTGAPATINVNLEGSLDNVTWYVLASSTSTTGDLQSVTGKPVRFVRANLTILTGGAAPTVTAKIIAAG